ncbi:zinc ribbon domain-containing protein [Ferroacidibacillus organovorans]|uniref:Zinc-ribbon domain-containing protein n=1 Tax=Ferroacidibacillus organovorans TaxID=1765683 RepID=A0A101XTL0_9BACL|nr:zinc ribbon domain-containing protein [Ferroacidibacillus organovorans]KUO97229.1 hypothetical protein ATW55_11580 [Ferroacidibacillus organovorans]
MKRLSWIGATLLVFLGALCLVMAGSGVSVRPMGSMMGSMMAFSMLGMIAFLFFIVILFAILFLWLQTRRETAGMCRACGRRLHSDWRVCPYCGDKIERSSER